MSTQIHLGDADLRPPLKSYLSQFHDPEAVFLEELGICQGRVRIDVAVVDNEFHGYEIKSGKDNLNRLQTQIEYYNRVVDKASLIVAENHLEAALKLLPRWWGIIRIIENSETVTFDSIRPAIPNPKRDIKYSIQYLWKEDALAFLESKNMAKGIRGKSRARMWDRIYRHCNPQEIDAAVRAQLRSRPERMGK